MIIYQIVVIRNVVMDVIDSPKHEEAGGERSLGS